jgi:hypothetical protein
LQRLTDEIEAEDLVRIVSFTRIVIGAAAFFAPRTSARIWAGQDTVDAVSRPALRGMGMRDIALGLGTLLALERGAPVRGWLEAGALSDAGDALSALADPDVPGFRRIATLVSASGAAYLGIHLAEELDHAPV